MNSIEALTVKQDAPGFSTTLYAEGEKESTTGNYSKKSPQDSILWFTRQVGLGKNV